MKFEWRCNKCGCNVVVVAAESTVQDLIDAVELAHDKQRTSDCFTNLNHVAIHYITHL